MRAERISLLKPTAVNTILAEVRALQAQGRKVVSLMRGEPDFATPDHITDAAVRALKSGRTTYPENRGEPVLREAVSQKLARDNGLQYDAGSEVLITDGATLGVYAALLSSLNPGDEVLVPDPVYDAYQSPVRLAGARVLPVPSTVAAGRFDLTVEALEATCTPATRALLLNTPWNPVGTVFTRPELAAITDFVTRHDLMLISDEIYEAIIYDGFEHLSPVTVSETVRERCVIVNSLSKTYAMTGWRVGYCAAPKEIVQAMLLIVQQSSRGPATFVQDAGAAALNGSQSCVQEMRTAYARRRRLVLEMLNGLPNVNVLRPEGGFFAMVDVRRTGLSSDQVRKHLLNEHGVVVAHGSAYGAAGEGMLRVSFASGGDNLAEGLHRLREGLASL